MVDSCARPIQTRYTSAIKGEELRIGCILWMLGLPSTQPRMQERMVRSPNKWHVTGSQ